MRIGLFIIALLSVFYAHAQVAEVRTYGGVYFDEGRDICEWDDGYALVSTTSSVEGASSDILLHKLNEDLSVEWVRILGNANSEQVRSVVALPDGDILVFGQTANGTIGGYDLVLFRVDGQGEVTWRKEYGTSDWDLASRMVFGNSTIFMSATTFGSEPGGSRMLLLRVGQDGEVLDENTYDILPDAEAEGLSFYGGYNYLVGTRTYEGQTSQAVLRKLTPSGTIVWEQVRDSVAFLGNSVHVSEFGVAAGFTVADQTEDGNWDLLLTGFNFEGEEVWNRWDNPPDPGLEICRDILWYDSNIIISAALSGIYGAGGDGAKVLRNDAGGFFIGSSVFGGEEDEEPFRMAKDSAGRMLIVGRTDSFGNGNDDIYLIRLPNGEITGNYEIDFEDLTSGGVFVGVSDEAALQLGAGPNPTKRIIHLPAQANWQLLSPEGKILSQGLSRNIDVSAQPAGLYLIRWYDLGNWHFQRIVKQ